MIQAGDFGLGATGLTARERQQGVFVYIFTANWKLVAPPQGVWPGALSVAGNIILFVSVTGNIILFPFYKTIDYRSD
jgi:hypothetical protein